MPGCGWDSNFGTFWNLSFISSPPPKFHKQVAKLITVLPDWIPQQTAQLLKEF